MATFFENTLNTYKGKLEAFTGSGNILSNVILYAEEKRTPFTITGARISVFKANDIKSTSLVGKTGSVKELIQAKDYAVKISGTLIGVRDLFPYAELTLLNRVLSDTKSILVASTYLATFGIFRLAFRECVFDQGCSSASPNVLPFTLNFESDFNCDFISKEISVNKMIL